MLPSQTPSWLKVRAEDRCRRLSSSSSPREFLAVFGGLWRFWTRPWRAQRRIGEQIRFPPFGIATYNTAMHWIIRPKRTAIWLAVLVSLLSLFAPATLEANCHCKVTAEGTEVDLPPCCQVRLAASRPPSCPGCALDGPSESTEGPCQCCVEKSEGMLAIVAPNNDFEDGQAVLPTCFIDFGLVDVDELRRPVPRSDGLRTTCAMLCRWLK